MSPAGEHQLHPLAPAHPGHGADLRCPLLMVGLKMGPVCCHTLPALFSWASNRKSPVVLSTPDILLFPEPPERCSHQNSSSLNRCSGLQHGGGHVLQHDIKMKIFCKVQMKAEGWRKEKNSTHHPHELSCQTPFPEPPRGTRRPPLGAGTAAPPAASAL